MVTVTQTNGIPITCVVGDPKIGQYMRQGATLYRNSREPGIVHLVPPGEGHARAWAEVNR